MRVLEVGELVLELGCPCHGALGDDEMARSERPRALAELLDCLFEIRSRKRLVLLALDDAVPAVRVPARQVDALLCLSAGAIATEPELIEAEEAPGDVHEQLFKSLPADV